MEKQTFVRYEEKYLISQETKERLLKKLKSHIVWDEHSDNEREYSVYNVYYDTDNDTIVRYSLDKPMFKNKLRIRTYMDFNDVNQPVFLEMKSKYDGKVFKRRVELSLETVQKVMMNQTISDQSLSIASKQIIDEMIYYQRCFQVKPRVFLKYKRLAFNDKYHHTIRMTLDHQIQYRTHDLFQTMDDNLNLLQPDEWIFEVKSPHNFPMWLVQILSDLHMHDVRFSKINHVYLKEKNGEFKS